MRPAGTRHTVAVSEGKESAVSEQPSEEQVPGGGLSGNEEGASSDGDTGPKGASNDPKPGNEEPGSAATDDPGDVVGE